ncbi:hypothetical protein [Gallaecimonas sp. GXIMD4217]|uniref:hypothetical protein n=1 Tax=Gallaecimonas sp. GXIMD4217 TaxID=3131927 RepID=UPI00311B1C92
MRILIPLFLLLPKFGFVDFGILFLFFYVVFFRKLRISLDVGLVLILIIIGLALVSSIFSGGVITAEYVLKPVRLLLVYVLAKSCVPFNVQSFVEGLSAAVIINSLLIYFQFLGSMYGFDVYYNPDFFDNHNIIYRQPGFFAGYPEHSILLAMSLVLSFSYSKRCFYALVLVALPSAIFSGRTGVYSLLLGLLITSFFSAFFTLKGALRISTLVAILCASFLFISSHKHHLHPQVSFALEHVLLPLEGLMSGRMGDYSTEDLLQNHYKFPDDITTLLVGNSLPPFEGGVESDVSIIRILYGNGIFSLLLYLILFLYFSIHFLTSPRGMARESFILCLIFLIALLKGPFLFSRVVGDAFLLSAIVFSSVNRRA